MIKPIELDRLISFHESLPLTDGYIDAEQQSYEYEVNTIEHLQQILNVESNIRSLRINSRVLTLLSGNNARILFTVLDHLRGSLQLLCISARDKQNSLYDFNKCKSLLVGIQSCKNIESLSIEFFDESFGCFINDFYKVLPSLPKLKNLSFWGTNLVFYPQTFFAALRHHGSLKKLVLSFALTNRRYESLKEIIGNQTIEEFVLGQSPISLAAIQNVVLFIVATKSKIKNIQWTPPSFCNNELLYWYKEKQDRLAYENFLTSFTHATTEVKAYQTNNSPSKEIQQRLRRYEGACCQLISLKQFLKDRNNVHRKTELVFELLNEYHVNFDLISAFVSLHSASLQSLIIKCSRIETKPPSAFDVHHLVDAVKKCTQLRTLKIEGLQGTFRKEEASLLVGALKELRNLKVLSFNRTYIGQSGMLHLADVFLYNNILSVDFTLAGLISSACLNYLVKAIAVSQNLQKLIMGRSPMTISWFRLVKAAIEQNPRLDPAILNWEFTSQEMMMTQMQLICDELYDLDYIMGENNAKWLFQTYCEEINNIDEQWQELNKPSVEVEDELKQSPDKNEIEMSLLSGSNLTLLGGTAKRNYGSTSNAPQNSQNFTMKRP